MNAAKTTCKRGHALSGPNIRMRGGKRVCLLCRRLYPNYTRVRKQLTIEGF